MLIVAIAAAGTPGDFRQSRRSAYKIAKCVAGFSRSLSHTGNMRNDVFAIGHFRVAVNLTMKVRLSANFSYEN